MGELIGNFLRFFFLLTLSVLFVYADKAIYALASIWLGFLLVWLFIVRRRLSRLLITVLYLALTCYSSLAYFAAVEGLIFFGVEFEVIKRETALSLSCIVFSFLIVDLVLSILGRRFLDAEAIKAQINRRIENISDHRFYAISALVAVIGILLWAQMFSSVGLSELLQNMRAHKDKIFATSNLYFQLFSIPVSIILGFCTLNSRGRKRAVGILCLIILWAPLLLIGARKEILLVFLPIFLLSNLPRRTKILAGVLMGILMLLIAVFREGVGGGDILVELLRGMHEFVLPQYVHFVVASVLSEAELNQLREMSGYGAGVWALLPGPLRLEEFVDLGRAFFTTGSTNVGLGANPIGEAVLNFGSWGYPFFLVEYTGLLTCIFLVSRKYPEVFVIAFPYLFIFGRSDIWVSLFYIVYSSVLMLILLRRFKI